MAEGSLLLKSVSLFCSILRKFLPKLKKKLFHYNLYPESLVKSSGATQEGEKKTRELEPVLLLSI
jgi:hypothetical protein